MAVYTHVSAEALGTLLARYDAGTLVSAKGIAEGVENSNYLVETSTDRFILTLYERRVDAGDLPFFLALLDHLAAARSPVPRAIADREGVQIQSVAGRPAQARAAGEAMGDMHRALADFRQVRANSMGVAVWRDLFERCGRDLDSIEAGLFDRVKPHVDAVLAAWPAGLPVSAIHADLFPDNVLMLGDKVTGLIDFYFACTDIRAYDLAVMHGAWAFDGEGRNYDAAVGKALIAGYTARFGLSEAERAALPVLARGAALRFFLTRAWDWLNTPADALVTRKDPLAYLRRLEHYAATGEALFA